MDDSYIILLRMIERLMVVGFGGMAIFLGYRLFFHLPHQTGQNGEIELPGVKVVLSRVGPGVFFLAFGALILITNLYRGVESTQVRSGAGSGTLQSGFSDNGMADNSFESSHISAVIAPDEEKYDASDDYSYSQFAGAASGYSEVDEQSRTAMINYVGNLNCIVKVLASVNEMDHERDNAIYHARTHMLLSVWDYDYWGDTQQLTDAAVPIENTSLEEVFNHVSMDCELP